MKRLTIAVALTMTAGLASAADLPVVKGGEPTVPVVTPFDWTGPYIGAHAGFGWGKERDNQSDLFQGGSVGDLDSFDMKGVVGGLHAGYNYQLPSGFVVGVEGDVDYTGIKGNPTGFYADGASIRRLKLETPWQGSLRLRAGYGFDQFLVYATGGLAIAEGKLSNSGTDSGAAIASTSSTKTHLGWTVGLGAEYAFTPNWIGRAEVRYSDFQKKTYQTFDGPVKSRWDQVTATLGISYKF